MNFPTEFPFQKLLTRPIVFFDLETTGLDVNSDEIVQAVFVKYYPSQLQKEREVLQFYCMPSKPLTAEVSEIHGITMEILEEKSAKPFSEWVVEVVKFIDKCDVSGYNSNNYDIPLLMTQIENHSHLTPIPEFERLIDVKKIFFRQNTRHLSDAYYLYTGKILDNAHNALYDVMATVEVFQKQVEQLLDTETLGKDLMDGIELYANDGKKRADLAGKFYMNEVGSLCFGFGKHKDQPVEKALSYCNWFLNSDFPLESKMYLSKYLDIKNGVSS